MIFGMIMRNKISSYSALFLLLISQQVYSLELSGLLNVIAITTQETRSFTETKTAFFLDKPLVSKGALTFIAPSTLYKKITFPNSSGQKIQGDEISILSPNEPLKTSTLSAFPKLALSINAIRWILSGNVDAIQQNFKVLLNGSLQNWSIQLIPLDEQLQQEIPNIVVSGRSKNITSFNVKRSNGDEVRTELYEPN